MNSVSGERERRTTPIILSRLPLTAYALLFPLTLLHHPPE